MRRFALQIKHLPLATAIAIMASLVITVIFPV